MLKHIAFTLLTLASVAFTGAILVSSVNMWPPDLDRALWTLTLLRWALVLGVLGGFAGLGAAMWKALTTPEGKR